MIHSSFKQTGGYSKMNSVVRSFVRSFMVVVDWWWWWSSAERQRGLGEGFLGKFRMWNPTRIVEDVDARLLARGWSRLGSAGGGRSFSPSVVVLLSARRLGSLRLRRLAALTTNPPAAARPRVFPPTTAAAATSCPLPASFCDLCCDGGSTSESRI